MMQVKGEKAEMMKFRTEQEVRERYPDAEITPGMRRAGWKIDRSPRMTAELTQAQWLVVDALAHGRPLTGSPTVPLRRLAAYGLVEQTPGHAPKLTPAGRDYAAGHFRHGWIPKSR